MSSRSAQRRDYLISERVSRKILRQIAAMDPFADSDPSEVQDRLRNMKYGSTHNRISALRRSESVNHDTAIG